MKTVIYAILALLAAGLVAHFVAAYRFNTLVSTLRTAVMAAVPEAVPARPPAPVAELARRNGAAGARGFVTLTQSAEIRQGPTGDWRPLRAHQTIALSQAGFVWVADQPGWPVPPVRVLDAFVGGEGRLQARLFGSVPLANETGPQLSKGEAMRYLAELPWAADALLSNPDLVWEVVDPATLSVSLALPDDRATVLLRLDEAGDVTEILAKDRADIGPDGTVEFLDWRGLLSEYAEVGGRRIPTRAEIGYIYADGYAPYFRGEITSYEVHSP